MNEKIEYEAVIGLEVHAQLLTQSKMFCGCSTRYGQPPNTQTCPVCLGLPGILPVINEKAVEYTVKMGLATGCRISTFSRFARKNYFYPDLPKGYQISQYDEPLCFGGYLEIAVNNRVKRIGITRIHLEEDAGKLIHLTSPGCEGETLIDFNRCGIPLIEIVSEPDINSPEEAYLYLMKLKQTLEYLEICNCNMEEGNLRCDANVSVRPVHQKGFGVKTEVKNMNSFKGVEKALTFEIKRQIDILSKGGRIIQETMLWDETANKAYPMRGKEEAHDYRYFPDPDLVPLTVERGWIEEIRKALPELPEQKKERFIKEYGLPEYDAGVLTSTKELADYYEETVKYCNEPKLVSNWVMGDILRIAKEEDMKLENVPVEPRRLSEMLNLIIDGTISGKIAKTVFEEMVISEDSPEKIIRDKNLVQLTDRAEIEKAVDIVLSKHPEELKKYYSGKKRILGFFVGEIMRETSGKANPEIVNSILREKLEGGVEDG